MNIALLSAISLVCADVAATMPLVNEPALSPQAAPAIESVAVVPEISVATLQETPSAEPEAEPEAESVRKLEREIGTGDRKAISDEDFQASIIEAEAEDMPLVFAGESDDGVVEKLRDYLEGIKTLQGDFTQIAPSGAISEGRFYLRRPGLLRFEYGPPSPLLIVANGGLVYVHDEALETTDSYPVNKTPLKFLLRRKIDLEDDVSVVNVDRGVDNLAVTFASKDDETEGELTVIVSAPEMTLRRWIVRDLQNGITVVTLENVIQGERLSNRLFETPDAGGRFLKD